ncbi:hypothetical protein [Ruegeria sp. HKCCA5491]|uniref:hypothetical protein n=1 Tax=Ruegeria sp. HKCCA5491 TaxID=2682986 RepID=UPI001488258F|nr:hypothetical protein [Ruegeria sp. HKCCA5491]
MDFDKQKIEDLLCRIDAMVNSLPDTKDDKMHPRVVLWVALGQLRNELGVPRKQN